VTPDALREWRWRRGLSRQDAAPLLGNAAPPELAAVGADCSYRGVDEQETTSRRRIDGRWHEVVL